MNRRAQVVVGLLVVAAIIGGLGWSRTQEPGCQVTSSVIDGVVLPGGPQSPEEALEEFIATALAGVSTGTEYVDGPEDWTKRVDGGAVSFTNGEAILRAYHQANGWIIGSIETTC